MVPHINFSSIRVNIRNKAEHKEVVAYNYMNKIKCIGAYYVLKKRSSWGKKT
jgi:hypothetical protein